MAPYVKAFMLAEFGPEPIAIHSSSFMGALLIMNAEKCPYRLDAPKLNTQGLTTLKVTMPKSLRYKTITPESARAMGNFLDKFFRQQFILWVKGQIEITGNENHALNTFYDRYQLNPDHMDLETLRKVWRDAKEKIARDLARQAA